jgi:hypothetical protein
VVVSSDEVPVLPVAAETQDEEKPDEHTS